jgi:light-regulated signal transduction histidine kinase (bacteriophytochrome)
MFAYSVSHDLRQPLRAMNGFSQTLLEQLGGELGERHRHYLNRVCVNVGRMETLIEGLLVLSRVNRRDICPTALRLDAVAREIMRRLREADPDREVEASIDEPLPVLADLQLMESALSNLLGNAWKFSAGRTPARIALGSQLQGAETVYFVRDNGAGFDMAYADKLFGPFQRLHSDSAFEGTGIGLATVQRIVHRHGGRIWADSAPGRGAIFFFTLADAPRGEAR